MTKKKKKKRRLQAVGGRAARTTARPSTYTCSMFKTCRLHQENLSGRIRGDAGGGGGPARAHTWPHSSWLPCRASLLVSDFLSVVLVVDFCIVFSEFFTFSSVCFSPVLFPCCSAPPDSLGVVNANKDLTEVALSGQLRRPTNTFICSLPAYQSTKATDALSSDLRRS